MNNINGYIEVNGVIYKITSAEDLKNLALSLGKEFKELSFNEIVEMCSNHGREVMTDDCGIIYNDRKVLWRANATGTYMRQYKVLDGTYAIANEAFYNYWLINNTWSPSPSPRNVDRLNLPTSLLAIGFSAFKDNALNEINFPDNIRYVGNCAFQNTTLKLKIIRFPKKMQYLGANAFENNKQIENIIFSDEIKKICSHAFKGCSSLISAYLPASLVEIGSGIFDDCPNFKNIFIPRGSMEKFKGFFPFDTEKLVEVEDVHTFEKNN